MRFGGHETFAVRDGWLYKGLTLLAQHPDLFSSADAADELGVGSNMMKSIRHWLAVTGLAKAGARTGSKQLEPTEIGELIIAHDPYMLESGTWWVLHHASVTHLEDAVVWSWFFNYFNSERFDRNLCTERLRRHLEMTASRQSSANTLMKDVLCLLNSYARPMPAEQVDPEDSMECPFRELGLITHFRDSGMYHLRRGVKDVPAHVFCYMLASMTSDNEESNQFVRIPLHDAIGKFGSPGRVLVLDAEALVDMVQLAEGHLGSDEIAIANLAGERFIQLRRRPCTAWLKSYYMEACGE